MNIMRDMNMRFHMNHIIIMNDLDSAIIASPFVMINSEGDTSINICTSSSVKNWRRSFSNPIEHEIS